jgi:membrane fusion protein, heavy metal efflux system
MMSVLCVVATTGCAQEQEASETPLTSEVAATTVRVDTGSFADVIDAGGVVTARTGAEVSLSAPSATRIERVHVAVGDRVSVGAPLVDFEAVLFEATLSAAESALQAAEQARARAERLVGAGVAPRRDLEQSIADVALARATAVSARRARQLTTLRAPIAGVVTRVGALRGANVSEQQPLIDIADPARVDLVLQLTPEAARRVRAGQSVALRSSAALNAALIGVGAVAHVSPVVDSATRSVAARVAVAQTSVPLRIGETLFGSITAEIHRGAVIVSDESLVPHEEGFRVFVVDSLRVAHARVVTVGGRSTRGVWILDGLRRGELVVTAGAYGVDDGSVITSAAKTP